MPALDFAEIPRADVPNGDQDTFEFLARDFFQEVMGFSIEEGPDRGSDGGRDIIGVERRHGKLGESTVRWLISCKHKAHSGRSVNKGEEDDIIGRCRKFNATGFIGFYSTIAGSYITDELERLVRSGQLEQREIFDREKIEGYLLGTEAGHRLAERYIPISYQGWIDNRPRSLRDEYQFECTCCGRNLLESGHGVVALLSKEQAEVEGENESSANHATVVEEIIWMCQGNCDTNATHRYGAKGLYEIRNYAVSDFILPDNYVETFRELIQEICHGHLYYAEAATNKLLHLFGAVSQMTLRHGGFEYARNPIPHLEIEE